MSQDLSLIPTLQENHYNPELARKLDEFKTRLNQPPPEAWLETHPMVNAKYLPIDKTELMLDRIFQDYKIEIVREGTMFQSCYVTVRVHYMHPVLGEWRFHDGTGASPVQKDKNTKFSIETIKDAGVQMALPIAKSMAIKDACDHLGKLFGRDVNRKTSISFQGTYMDNDKPIDKESERVILLLNGCKTKKDLQRLFGNCTTIEQKELYDKLFSKLQ